MNTTIQYILLLLVSFSSSWAQFQTYSDIIQTGGVRRNEDMHRKLVDFMHHNFNPYEEHSLHHTFSDFRGVLQAGLESLEQRSVGIKEKCLSDLAIFLNESMSSWGLEMLDSFGKPGSGIMNGNLLWFGDFDKCRAVQPIMNETIRYKTQQVVPFQTQYCFSALPVPLPGIEKNVNDDDDDDDDDDDKSSICVPDTCSDVELGEIINEGIDVLTNNNITLAQVTCQPGSIEMDNLATAALCVFGVLGFLILIGTAYDIIIQVGNSYTEIINCDSQNSEEKLPLIKTTEEEKKNLAGQFLLCFSLYTNGKKLLSTHVAAGSLTSINGIRFISMTWVVLGHVFYLIQSSASNSTVVLPQWIDRWTFGVIDNAPVCADTFFTISGLLVSYLLLKDMKKKKSIMINWSMFYFHRFWRLTPAYMQFILHNMAIAKYYGNGPTWPANDGFEPGCKHDWWKNLLYINNLFSLNNKSCYGVSWYLANDMQFYILSPILVIPFFWSAIAGYVMNLLWILGVFIATAVISTHYELGVSPLDFKSPITSSLNYSEKYYIKPWCRMGPYLVGVITGYLLYKCGGKLKINKLIVMVGWSIATVLACTVLYGISGHPDMSVTVKALYNTTHTTVWGVCICWVIFTCTTGNGGYVNTLLSWKPFLPLGRLTYCAYLTHFLLIEIYISYSRVPFYLTDINMILHFVGALTGTMILAFVTSLAFESPMIGLEKMLLQQGKLH